ncbi:MAG: hypothetical protein ABJC74_11050 [Gemmatimonadota bacterium]
MAAKKPSSKKMKTLPKKLSAKEASSVRGGAISAGGNTSVKLSTGLQSGAVKLRGADRMCDGSV